MKVAYFSPMPPEALPGIAADYSALSFPRSAACRRDRGETRGEAAAAWDRPCCIPYRHNPEAHGWILDACAVCRGRRPARLRPPPPRRGRDDRQAGTATATSTRWSGARRRRSPAATASSTSGCRRSGRRAPRSSCRGEVLSRDRSRRPLPLRRGRARAPDSRADRAVAHPAWPDPGVEPAAIEAILIGAFGNVNQSKRSHSSSRPSLARGAPGRAPVLVGPRRPASISSGGSSASARRRRIVREGYVDERRLWELMAACDVHVSLRSPTMGETSGTAIGADPGKPLVVSDVGWFGELPDGVALRVAVGDDEVARPRGGAPAPRRAARRP